MFPITAKIKLAAIGIALLAYSGSIVYVTHRVDTSAINKEKIKALQKEQAETKKQQQRADDAEAKLANTLATQTAKNTVITKEVVREIEKPVYHECVTTDDGVRLIEQAINAGNASREQHGEMP